MQSDTITKIDIQTQKEIAEELFKTGWPEEYEKLQKYEKLQNDKNEVESN